MNEEIIPSNFDCVFKRYASAIAALAESAPRPTIQQILAVLTARDAIHAMVLDKNQEATDYLLGISQLDKQLKEQGKLIAKSKELADLRSLLNPPLEAWWWFLDDVPDSFWNRFDWLWSALTIPWLAVNLSLVVDISTRFLLEHRTQQARLRSFFKAFLPH